MDLNNFLTILPAFSRQEQKCKKIFKIFFPQIFSKIFFKEFFFWFFFAYSAVPHQIRTTGKKIIKIHQLEQILGKCPYAGSMWGGVSLDHEIFEQQSARSRGRSPIFELGNPWNQKFCATPKLCKKLFGNIKLWV